MKYLILYENFFGNFLKKDGRGEYKVDDYVIINVLTSSRIAKIINYIKGNKYWSPIYSVEFSNGDTLDYINDNNIKRLATPEEIEEYEMEKSAKQYNL